MRYHVYEVQEESVWRKWHYTVDANSPGEALEKARSGSPDCSEPEDHGTVGESDFLESGYAVSDGSAREARAWRTAMERLAGESATPRKGVY